MKVVEVGYLIIFALCFGYIIAELQTTVIKRATNDTCGISTGGPIVQQLTEPISYFGGVFWEVLVKRIAYVDSYGSAFGSYWPQTGALNRFVLPTANKSYVAVFPVHNATDPRFVLIVDQRLQLIYSTGSGANVEAHIFELITISQNKHETFFVGKTDSRGRIWTASGSHRGLPLGKLYKIDNLQKPVVMYENLHTGSGMAWTKDDRYFYLVDTDIGVIYKFDFDVTNGTISNERIVFNIQNHTDICGKPFDLEVDQNGYLWIGIAGSGSVIQYDESTESILWEIPTPAKNIVSVEFGGEDLDILYIGTASSKHERSQPGAGSLFGMSGLGVKGFGDAYAVIPEKYLNY